MFDRICSVVQTIPFGKVASYGDIAATAGNPRAARTVVWALRAAPEGTVPWHRVVNSRGMISQHENPDLQRALLEAEGVEFSPSGVIDLDRFSWHS